MLFWSLITAGATLIIGAGIYLCTSSHSSTKETQASETNYQSDNSNSILNSQEKIEQNSDKVEDSDGNSQDFFEEDDTLSDEELSPQQYASEDISEEINGLLEEELFFQEDELEDFPEISQDSFEEEEELCNEEIDYVNLPFVILPSGKLEREITLWLEKNYKNGYEYNKQLEIMNFLKKFNPVIVAKGQCFEQSDTDYVIMVFKKWDNKKIAVAESGEYGNATYYYETYSDNNSDWIEVFSLDKQSARRRAKRIYHDYTNHLYSWKNEIEYRLKNSF